MTLEEKKIQGIFVTRALGLRAADFKKYFMDEWGEKKINNKRHLLCFIGVKRSVIRPQKCA